jgi:CRISPR/Cas system-associated protein Cas10 (large subunit of type III CRISPR-Cas system)
MDLSAFGQSRLVYIMLDSIRANQVGTKTEHKLEIFSRLLGSVLSIIDISFLESAANNLEFAVWLISHFRPFAALGLYFWAKCKNGL